MSAKLSHADACITFAVKGECEHRPSLPAPQHRCGNCGEITLGGILRGALVYCLPCAREGFPEAYAKLSS